MISAFGVDHGGISKGFNQLAPKLMAAAASGDERAAQYAQHRLQQGHKASKVGPNLRNGPGGRVPMDRLMPGGKAKRVASQSARTARREGAKLRRQTKATLKAPAQPGGIGRMEAAAAQKLAPSAPAKQGMGIGTKLAIGGGLGAAAGGGAALYNQRQRRSA